MCPTRSATTTLSALYYLFYWQMHEAFLRTTSLPLPFLPSLLLQLNHSLINLSLPLLPVPSPLPVRPSTPNLPPNKSLGLTFLQHTSFPTLLQLSILSHRFLPNREEPEDQSYPVPPFPRARTRPLQTGHTLPQAVYL